ncbi:molybdate ABC transporter substrate-binding protein [Vibrio sp. OCN044]|uniref:Molybdate ABC transporter substrate-binding protein n=1 Tax=Vibrio tetraodonis subsp. pristinus TaxID=2695891 RepID=A0A6L8LZY4_9VIBR|nr:molybdate ABC transporter substrate-binding protein [Vibrio tetraodonis]MYM58762.1 molybdate ABC transporter substrate-binding protein [Vibrio tetraodonis subsp. pristinus]
MNLTIHSAVRAISVFFVLWISTGVNATSINVYAASSLTNVIKALGDAYYAKTGVTVVPVLASSSSLAKQILAGAPADIYISANTQWVDYLVEKNKIQGDAVTNVASNKLVVIAPNNQLMALDVSSKEQWLTHLKDKRLVVGDTRAVPVGIYAKQALQAMGVWQSLHDKLAPVSNVRVALRLIEREEAPLGIVYQTDAQTSNKVKVVATFPSSSHTMITYPMALLNSDTKTLDFANFVQSKQGTALLNQYGFQ